MYHLVKYGCRAYIKINTGGDKLDDPARPGVMVGYEDDIKTGYHVFVPSSICKLILAKLIQI